MLSNYKTYKFLLLICLCISLLSCDSDQQYDKIDLAGEWQVRLDSLDRGQQEHWQQNWTEQGQKIQLPGTLDEAGIGTADTLTPALNTYVLSNLSRKHQYIGKAWYQKQIEIPQDWDGKPLVLNLERVLWKSTVFINDTKVGSRESLIGNHLYELYDLKTGANTLTILIDNSDFYPDINIEGSRYPSGVNREMAHAYTNHTQIKWNGILGDISIKPISNKIFKELQVYPNIEEEFLSVEVATTEVLGKPVVVSITDQTGTEISSEVISAYSEENNKVNFKIAGKVLQEWDEFKTQLYTLVVQTQDEKISKTFGYRSKGYNDGELMLNGHRIFLRGNLECVIFPLTGRPPLQKEDWLSLYQKAKDYGLNHFRFHSWCPPEAAFAAADEIGMYLQVELPHWSLKVGEDEKTWKFLNSEADKIIADYGHHPSFIFMSMGNELEGDFGKLNELVSTLKEKDSRHLYATTSFSFQTPVGKRPEPEDEFFVTQWTDKGWIRGQGVFNEFSPNFKTDYSENSTHIETPLISHEIGQYSVYPDISEIEKYTGVLQPLNFIAIKNDLEDKKLLSLAPEFTKASGKLAAMLYKEEIERALKTPAFDGFQLLQLQDFPGQGTALVGLLNAFWESKGAISAEEFSTFNSPLTPLARFDKAIYKNGETFKADLEIVNFFKPLKDQKLIASLKNSSGETISETVIEHVDLIIGNNNSLGILETSIQVDAAEEWQLKLSLEGTDFENSWPVWVYPNTMVKASENIQITSSFQKAKQWLQQGKRVLLNPSINNLKGVEGRFVPVFWSPVHFPDQPGTMGLLIDKEHQALANFPTQEYTQWQWWDLCKQSKSVIIDEIPIQPIVRVIDNFVTNHSMATLFEAKVGNGKLLFSSMDILSNLRSRPAAQQLHNSLIYYMNSDSFNPDQELDFENLKAQLSN
ncbi:sugar-binding domain-containing protein [Leeuwenhoekiella sp. UBA6783]|uniref:sugar-binding domain-containing protein n=1 Tax=Leeuwenhoekiella sp. UBA6783 TaxID=1946747 RepID=UPI0025C0BE86|nr:sugar-binding domain-containing protein [Leeuwenhoekiella sp. UBA6783]|tara:strand:- start:4592 stop:7357 length:2766 start_codon:yes stop_codon:yes gene_type:complete